MKLFGKLIRGLKDKDVLVRILPAAPNSMRVYVNSRRSSSRRRFRCKSFHPAPIHKGNIMMTKTAARKHKNMRELVNAYRLAQQNC